MKIKATLENGLIFIVLIFNLTKNRMVSVEIWLRNKLNIFLFQLDHFPDLVPHGNVDYRVNIHTIGRAKPQIK